jgi:circadian clock protein KaiB
MDVSETPEVAATEQILALPTVVRRQPKPTRRIIGDLGDTDRILISLGVKAMSSSMLSA